MMDQLGELRKNDTRHFKGFRPRRSNRVSTPTFLALEERTLLSVFGRETLLENLAPAPQVDLYRLSDDLVDLYATQVMGLQPPAARDGFTPTFIPLLQAGEGQVAVRVTANDVAAIQPLLAGMGFVTTVAMPTHHLVEGYLPVDQLMNVTTLSTNGLLGVMGIARPMTSTGSVLSEADFTLQSARTRATVPPGVTGAGVTIGVLSDSFNNKGGAAAGIASGDLPTLIFNRDLASGGSDEGRAMVELAYDIAPGSPFAFATAFTGEAGFAQNIRDLAKPVANGGAGAKVIVDDVFYFAEPMFQDGIIAQAVDDVVTNSGAAYFSSAGNLQDQAYENTSPTFVTTTIAAISGSPARYLQFSPGFATQNITLNAQQFLAGLQWSDPFYTSGGVQTNLDFFIIAGGSILSSSTSNNIATNIPNELVGVAGTGTAQLVIRLTAGADPTRLKWVNFGSNGSGPATIQFATNSPTITPHSASVNAMSVAASPMFDQRVVESFSSKGPATFLFDPAGNAIPTTVRAKPDFMATDGTSNTFFGQNVPGVGFLFFGTSAAAPNAAAVAALVRQANPGFTPAQVYNRLITTADPNVTGGVNFVGAGLIDAYRAVIGQPTTVSTPVADGFESGVLSQDWDVWNNGSARTIVSAGNSPASGNYQLVLDSVMPSGFGLPGLGESILHANLAGKTGVTLAFEAKRFGSETIQAMPVSFTDHSNSDGVALSVDGVNWYRLNSLSTTTTTYQPFNIDVSAAAAAAGLVLSADTQIKFQRYGTGTGQAPATGLAFDNVDVSSIVAATTVTDVTSTTANGTYGTGATIDITVTFTGVVNVTGVPQLALNPTGGPAAVASYLSGTGTSTLTFRYIVSAGQSSPDLDYTSTNALTLNGGTIIDAAASPAVLTLPSPGATGSLGANKNIVIDAVAPLVAEYRVLFGAKSYNLIGSGRNVLPWQVTGVQVVFTKPIAAADVNSLTGLTNTAFAGLGTTTLTWTINPLIQGNFATSLLGTGASAIKDSAGNALTTFAQNFKVLYGDYNDDGFVTSADMVGVYGATVKPYDIFADLNGDGLVDISDVLVARMRNGKKL